MLIQLSAPEYRIRLFLSVDLTGSTAFKAASDSANLEWLKLFQLFYRDFPSIFVRNYIKYVDSIGNISPVERAATPSVWKTIGDEIIFVNRIYSLMHLGVYISSFTETLKEFGALINSKSKFLNTKGNGWVATFPSPNCSLKLDQKVSADSFADKDDLTTEEFELGVDENPRNYDFLGKGIDSGFRIARNSTMDMFTISYELASLLCRAMTNKELTKFSCEFQFHKIENFKGVLNGSGIPVIGIYSGRDAAAKELIRLESALLKKPNLADVSILDDYLDKFMKFNKVECPKLKICHSTDDVGVPEHYSQYLKAWEDAKNTYLKQEQVEEEAAKFIEREGDTSGADSSSKQILADISEAVTTEK